MKSARKDKKEQKYPKLMECVKDNEEGYIVLFSGERIGTVIDRDRNCKHEVGYANKGWTMFSFTDYIGTVELSND